MKLRRLAVAAAALAAGCAHARQSLRTGGEAPDIKVEVLLQAPEPRLESLRSLRGNVVVLEFWATWCPPCVGSIPHLNRLAVKLKDKPVRFISITDEPLPVVRKFLVDQPMAGWIGIDADGSAFKTYGARSRPLTVVIGPDGLIAALTFPDELSEKALLDVLAGRKPELRLIEPANSEAEGGRRPSGPLVSISLSTAPSDAPPSSFRSGESGFAGKAVPLSEAISAAFGVPDDRIELSPSLASAKIDVEAEVPWERRELFKPLFQNALIAAYGLDVKRRTKTVDVYILAGERAGPGLLRAPEGGAHGSSWRPGSITGVAEPLDWLAGTLEDELDRPVLNETRLPGRWSFELNWDSGRKDGVAEGLRPLGLELLPDRRPVELLVVGSAEKVVK